jgi:CMP-N,N'-diacetyllegionaminic acid synthase
MRTLAVVPARGGSKGVPRKNIKLLAGKPLLQYTAEAALGSRRLTKVILSTEDEEIAQVGRDCGLQVPFIRPSELAKDDTPTLPVVQHAVRTLEAQGEVFDAICILQPTNPLRTAADIDGCIELLARTTADSVVSVLAVPHEHNPHWVYFCDENNELHLSTGEATPIPRRQELPPAYHRDGSVYLMRRDTLIEKNSLYGSRLLGYLVARERSVNVDTHEDFQWAETMLSNRAMQRGTN